MRGKFVLAPNGDQLVLKEMSPLHSLPCNISFISQNYHQENIQLLFLLCSFIYNITKF